MPESLWAKNPPSFDSRWLPNLLGDYAQKVADSIQVPIDMPGIAILAVLSLCNSGKYAVSVNDNFSEPLNLFCVIVADPSERKSSVLKEIASPVAVFEQLENKRIASQVAKDKSQRNILEKSLLDLEAKAVKDPSKIDEALALAERLTHFKEMQQLRLLADDVTVEKLASLLAENDGKIGIFSSEGNIFDMFSGQYKNGQHNFDSVLKAYSGDAIRVDRLGRPSEYIENPVLTMLLMIQPTVLEGIVNNKYFKGKGLVSRFIISIPESRVGSRVYSSTPVPQALRDSYHSLITSLLQSQPGELKKLTFSYDAISLMEKFHDEVEGRLLEDMAEIRAFGGKLIGLTRRIAGNLHIVECPDRPEHRLIEAATVSKAIEISKYTIEHAFAAMDISTSAVYENSRYVLQKIILQGEQVTTRRSILRACSRYSRTEELDDIIEQLQKMGYIRRICKEGTSIGRPKEEYQVNPHVFSNLKHVLKG